MANDNYTMNHYQFASWDELSSERKQEFESKEKYENYCSLIMAEFIESNHKNSNTFVDVSYNKGSE